MNNVQAEACPIETARLRAILTDALGHEHRDLALYLAFETAVPADQVLAILRAHADGINGSNDTHSVH